MSLDPIERFHEEMPEPKLELLDGRVTVGNGAGNLRLLHHLLTGWGAEAALPLAANSLWLPALHEGFKAFGPPHPCQPFSVWRAWAGQLHFVPEIPLAGPMVDLGHSASRDKVLMGLSSLALKSHFAHVAGRDILMRLGNDAFTPDTFVLRPRDTHPFFNRYLEGPADLVIEVLLPGHEAYDRTVKRQRYGAGGVPEYWIVDPCRQRLEVLCCAGGDYRSCPSNAGGKCRPRAFPDLALDPKLLWDLTRDWLGTNNPFQLEGPVPRLDLAVTEGGSAWGDLPFDPDPELTPKWLSFTEFAAWTPQIKFESMGNKPCVGGRIGSRNVIGMLLRTEGLTRAVSVLHPREWIDALVLADEDRQADVARRERWWAVARQAACVLRQQFNFGRLVAIGDLTRRVSIPRPPSTCTRPTPSPWPSGPSAVRATTRPLMPTSSSNSSRRLPRRSSSAAAAWAWRANGPFSSSVCRARGLP